MAEERKSRSAKPTAQVVFKKAIFPQEGGVASWPTIPAVFAEKWRFIGTDCTAPFYLEARIAVGNSHKLGIAPPEILSEFPVQ